MNGNDMPDRKPARLEQLMAHQGIVPGFIADVPLRQVEGGIEVTVRLTSYRSLPLSCIEAVELAIDGETVDPAEILLRLNGVDRRISELRYLSKTWWFILDTAVLFVPRSTLLAAGAHHVSGALTTVEPYITAGRFSFRTHDEKKLPLEEPTP